MNSPVALVVAVVLATGPPVPEGVDPDAWTIAQSGIAAYEVGDYTQAREELRRAYARSPHPAILYAWAQAERNAGNCEAASSLYELFLETANSEAQRDYARHHLETCRRKLASQPPPEPTPLASVPEPEPEPEPEQTPVDNVSSDQRKDRGEVAAIVSTIAVGGAAFVAGVTLFGIAQSRVTEQRRTENYDRFDALDQRIASLRIGAAVAVGVAVPLVTVGIVLAVRKRKRTRSSRVQTRGFVTPQGAGLRF